MPNKRTKDIFRSKEEGKAEVTCKKSQNGEVCSLKWLGLEHGEDVREKEPFVTISSRIVFLQPVYPGDDWRVGLSPMESRIAPVVA